MAKKKSFKDNMSQQLYLKKDVNQKIMKFKKSWDEVNKMLNTEKGK